MPTGGPIEALTGMAPWGVRVVRDDPEQPDAGFAELFASLPDAADPEPWLGWCRRAGNPVLYLGIGTGRLAAPLAAAGVKLLGVDAHPGMLERCRARLPEVDLVRVRIEAVQLRRRFEMVMGPAGVLNTPRLLSAATAHSSRWVAFELPNPHWLAAGAGHGVRVVRFSDREAQVEVDYPGGWRQAAAIPLVWPERVDDFLAGAGLGLELMRGTDAEADLAGSPAFYVLASITLRRAQIPSTY